MKSLSILFVEDDIALATSTAKLIERFSKHRVRITDNPETIFELCTTGKIDFVIMDINLPETSWAGEEVSGIDLSRILKTKSETAHIPIVIFTAYGMAEERESFMADSLADDFITKPIQDYQIFIAQIEQLGGNEG